MSDSDLSLPHSASLHSALAWLDAPAAADPLDDLVPLRQVLAALNDEEMTWQQLFDILERFKLRAKTLNQVLKPMLRDAALPIDVGMRRIADSLLDMHGVLAQGYLRVASEAEPADPALIEIDIPLLCTYALLNLARQFEVSLLVVGPVPAALWSRVQALYYLMRKPYAPEETLPGTTALADKLLKEMLALAAAQPEGMTPREASFLIQFLARYAAEVDIREELPARRDAWFWLKEGRDNPPMAVVRRPPPVGGRLLFYSCAELGRCALESIEKLAAGAAPQSVGLPPEAQLPAFLDVLKRAETRWGSPPKRQFQRRYQNYRVEVCTSFALLWQLVHGEGLTAVADPQSRLEAISDWMVFNESPEGYAMMHVAGRISGLESGSVLGLRLDPQQPWSVCIVRWARSDNPEHVEVGLELVAPHAEAVRTATSAASLGTGPATALLLPPLPRLQRGEALLASRGNHQLGRFSLVQDQSRLRISECEPGALATQTGTIEIFEFDRDPLRLT
jgi:hypothetical protein